MVSGDEELAALGVEDGGNCFVVRDSWLVTRIPYHVPRAPCPVTCIGQVDYVGGDDVECIDGDDFCSVGQVHSLCDSCGNPQAGEAARPDGDINMLNLAGFLAEAAQQAMDGRKNFCTVSERCGKGGFGEYILAEGQCYGAYSAGRFKG